MLHVTLAAVAVQLLRSFASLDLHDGSLSNFQVSAAFLFCYAIEIDVCASASGQVPICMQQQILALLTEISLLGASG